MGVARDAKVLDLSESPRPFIYRPYSQSYSASVSIIARTAADAERTALDMVAAARALDPELILWAPGTMRQHLDFVLLPFRWSAWILSVFATLAVALASVGVYGIVSYAVSRRTREVGIRMSLGASASAMTVLLMGSGMRLVALGAAAGWAASYFAARVLSGLLFGIDALDARTFVAAPVVLIAVATLATYIAAHRRAASIQCARSEASSISSSWPFLCRHAEAESGHQEEEYVRISQAR